MVGYRVPGYLTVLVNRGRCLWAILLILLLWHRLLIVCVCVELELVAVAVGSVGLLLEAPLLGRLVTVIFGLLLQVVLGEIDYPLIGCPAGLLGKEVHGVLVPFSSWWRRPSCPSRSSRPSWSPPSLWRVRWLVGSPVSWSVAVVICLLKFKNQFVFKREREIYKVHRYWERGSQAKLVIILGKILLFNLTGQVSWKVGTEFVLLIHLLRVGWRNHGILKNYWPNLLALCIFPDLSCLFRNIWQNLLDLCLFPLNT